MNLPVPPLETVMPATAQAVMLALTALGALGSLFLAWREVRRRGDWVPVYVLLGAALAIVYEPLGDMLGLAYYPEVGQIAWIDTFGRKTPLFVALIYFSYFPPFIFWFLRAVEAGITRATWWKLWGGMVLATFLFEPVPLHFGLWLYYGAQPFLVFKFPLYWAFVNASFVFGLAIGVHYIVRYFPPRQQWIIVPAMPMLLLCGHGAPSLPVATALNSSASVLVTSIGASVTILLCVLMSWAASVVLCKTPQA
jgi:hypothetical protein